MPFVLEFAFLWKLLKSNWKIILPVVLFVIIYGWWVGFQQGRENRVIKQCNEQVLKDQLDTEKKLREDLEKSNLDLQTRLTRVQRQNREQTEYMKELELYLNISNLPDDELSPRSREFVRQLNQRTDELMKEEAANEIEQ